APFRLPPIGEATNTQPLLIEESYQFDNSSIISFYFFSSEINTDDRLLRRTLHCSVRYSASPPELRS
ncbi:MAG: hypothetical protein ACXWV6_05325, partial [Chitinophagaceae bacterium]